MTPPSNPSPGEPMPSTQVTWDEAKADLDAMTEKAAPLLAPTPEHDDLDEAYRLSQDFDALTLLIAEHRDSNEAYASAIKEVHALKASLTATKAERDEAKRMRPTHGDVSALRAELDRVTREKDAAISRRDEWLTETRAALARANAEAEALRTAAKRHTDAVLLFGIAKAEYDCDRTDENARLVSEASCRQADALEALEKLLSTDPAEAGNDSAREVGR